MISTDISLAGLLIPGHSGVSGFPGLRVLERCSLVTQRPGDRRHCDDMRTNRVHPNRSGDPSSTCFPLFKIRLRIPFQNDKKT